MSPRLGGGVALGDFLQVVMAREGTIHEFLAARRRLTRGSPAFTKDDEKQQQ
jgi:hypothetical protein